MKHRTFLLTVGLIVTGAIDPVSLAAKPAAGAWEIGPNVRGRNYSVGMPAHPSADSDGSPVMDFPLAGRGQVDAVTTAVASLAGARQITLRYRIDAPSRTRFVASETPDEIATVSLYFQQAGDNWTGKGRYASYRWYAPIRAVLPLTAGEHAVTVNLGETWTNVQGVPNSQVPGGFATALRKASRIGIAFGSPSRRSHGVYATGPARFRLLELEVG